jgi:hypothetical protein
VRIGASTQAYLQLHSDTTTRAHTTTHPQSASGAHGKAGVFLRRGICRRCKGYQYSTSWSCISVDERVHTGDACGIGRGPSKCTQEMHAELVVGQASATARSHPCTCIGACLRAFVHTHMHVRQRVFAQNRTNISSCRTVPLAHRTRKRGLCSSAQGRQGEQPNEARAAGAQLLVIERRQACVDLSLKESVGQGNRLL